jgi:rhamnosyltransferase
LKNVFEKFILKNSVTGAIIVLYFPDVILLNRLLMSIGDQVEKIFVIDNTPGDHPACITSEWFLKAGFEVEYIALHDNYGIAKAQNCGIAAAIKWGCDHGMVEHLMHAEATLLASNVKVGSVGPIFIDEKTEQYSLAMRYGVFTIKRIVILPTETLPVQSDHLIASGALIRISALLEIGYMREELFIDFVDIEWCLRAKNFNYAHFMIPDAIMKHSIGDEYVSIAGKKIILHSDIRNYYTVRNACHLIFDKKMDRRWRLHMLFKIPKYVIFYSITSTSKQRLKMFVSLIRACLHGCMGRLGKAF